MIYDSFDIDIGDDTYLVEFDKNGCDTVTDFRVRQTARNNIHLNNKHEITLDEESYDFFSIAIDDYLDSSFGD